MGGGGEKGEKVQGIRSIIGRYKLDRGQLRIKGGNGEAKEFMCTTHGYELREWGMLVREGCRAKGNKREKKWDICNSIIN